MIGRIGEPVEKGDGAKLVVGQALRRDVDETANTLARKELRLRIAALWWNRDRLSLPVRIPIRDPGSSAQHSNDLVQTCAVVVAELVPVRVRVRVSVREVREVLCDERQITSARGGPQAERACIQVRRASAGDLSNEILEIL